MAQVDDHVNNRMCYFLAWPLVEEKKGLSNISRVENSIYKLILKRSGFSIKSPLLLLLWVWIRWCSKFIYFVRKDSSVRVTRIFPPTSLPVFIIAVAKSLLAGNPQFHEWALFFNQKTCNPWQVNSSGLVFDTHSWTKEAWILPTKGKEILLSVSHWGLMFQKFLWCRGTVVHLWFCMGKRKWIQCFKA